MRPYVICHMMATLDGRIDSEAMDLVSDSSIFEKTHPKLEADSWLCGRVTLQKNFSKYAETKTFDHGGKDPIGKASLHIAPGQYSSFAVAADSGGSILWATDSIDGDHIIVLTTERASIRYLKLLEDRGVSYVVTGTNVIDWESAFATLAHEFKVERLALEGGGHINGAVLQAGLVDELSLLLLPAIDGRQGIGAIFDGLPASPLRATGATLKSIDRLPDDILWLRYNLQGGMHEEH